MKKKISDYGNGLKDFKWICIAQPANSEYCARKNLLFVGLIGYHEKSNGLSCLWYGADTCEIGIIFNGVVSDFESVIPNMEAYEYEKLVDLTKSIESGFIAKFDDTMLSEGK